MARIQDFFSGGAQQITIPPGEYAGPLTISHSCTVDGNGATLWSKIGAALIIDAPNVTIKNLRVELTNQTADFIAIYVTKKNVHLENVEVYGNIRGLAGVSEHWDLPRTLNLGTFAAGERNEFLLKLKVGEPCQIINSVYGLKTDPQILAAGDNDVRLTIDMMRDGMILYGDLLLKTANNILRRIYLSGRAQNGAAVRNVSAPPPPPPQPSQPPQSQRPTRQSRQSNSVRVVPPPQPSQSPQSQSPQRPPRQSRQSNSTRTTPPPARRPSANDVQKGQRVFAPDAEIFQVAFKVAGYPAGMIFDGYAFCLGENKKVTRDEDMIFFNNPRHDSFGVYLDSRSSDIAVCLSLKDIPDEIKSVVVCFAIYDEGNRSSNNFSTVSSPEVIVSADGNICYEFPLQLDQEKAFTALEFYRNKGKWKINFIGAGFVDGLRKLCEFYGVNVM